MYTQSGKNSDLFPQLSLPNDLPSAIAELKKSKRAVILAHYYQVPQIQDIADFIGDSLGLSQAAAQTDAEIIVFAGVLFMAETAKILNPTRKVVVPDLAAGCSLADNCPADQFDAFIREHPGHRVVTYINCSAAVKGLSDIICTSANAEKIVNSIPAATPIIFAPDQHLGRYLIKKTGRPMVLWNGACIVHETFDERKIVQLKIRHPEALIIAHPECTEAVLGLADFIGSTTALLKFTQTNGAKEFIVVTESGIIHQMTKASPEKTFYSVPLEEGCSCAECPFMRLNTMEKLYLCLASEQPRVELSSELCAAARTPIERMLEISKS